MKVEIFVQSEEVFDLFSGKHQRKVKIIEANGDELIISAIEQSQPDSTIIVCQNGMLSASDPDQIFEVLEYLDKYCSYDIFYLTDYADRCDLFAEVFRVNNLNIVRTYSPHGLNAVAIKPSGKDKILALARNLEETGRCLDTAINASINNFKAYTSVPPLLTFDVTKRDDDRQFIFNAQCREIPQAVRPSECCRKNTTTLNLFWFILVLILIVCTTAILLHITNSSSDHNKYVSIEPPYDPTGSMLGAFRSV